MNKIKLGAQLYTLRNYIKTYEDTETTFKYLKDIGIDMVQISGIGPIEQEKVAELVNKYDMEVCVTHINADRLKNDTEQVIYEHKLINCRNIGIGSMPNDYRGSFDGIQAFIKDFSEVSKKLRAEGMQFQYHNHSFEFELYNGRKGMDILVEDSAPEDIHFILDTHWLQVGGVNPPDYIRKVKGRMEVCHFKDYKIVNNERMFAEICTGNLDLDECFKACQEANVGYIVIEQDSCEIDPCDSMAISYKNLVKLASKYQ